MSPVTATIIKIPEEYKQPLNPGQPRFYRSARFRYSVAEEARADFEDRLSELIAQAGHRISDFRVYDYVSDDLAASPA